jgi:predicted site-specific integrase-resolvase
LTRARKAVLYARVSSRRGELEGQVKR